MGLICVQITDASDHESVVNSINKNRMFYLVVNTVLKLTGYVLVVLIRSNGDGLNGVRCLLNILALYLMRDVN